MTVRLFLPNPEDTTFPFEAAWEALQWVAQTGAAITKTIDTTDADRDSILKVVSDTDTKGVRYTISGIRESTKHAFSMAYKCAAGQEIDYVIYDNSNLANISTGTLIETDWSYHYEEVDSPAGCIEIIIYLRAGTGSGLAFYIDDLKFHGNVLEVDPESLSYNYPKASSSKWTLDGTLRSDVFMVTAEADMIFPRLSYDGFDRMLDFHRSRWETYFNDQAVPSAIERMTAYLETQYNFTGISNPSGTHCAYDSKSASEPSAAGDFSTTEFTTADYNILDDDDENYVRDSASVTGHYQYHKFTPKISGEYASAADIQSFEVTYKGAANDASASNQDGVTVYLWNVTAGNWVEIGATRVSTKETVSLSLMKPEHAQMFVDTATGFVRVLVQTNGTKGAGTALDLDSYYVEVTVNKSLSTTVPLKNRAVLDDAGAAIRIENLTDDYILRHKLDYRIGDEGDSIIADKVSAHLDGNSQYFYRSDADFPESGITGANDLTIQVWIKPDSVSGIIKTIVGKWLGAGDKRMYLFRRDDDELIVYINDDGMMGGNTSGQSSGLNLVVDEWAFICAVYDASEGTVDFYKNGAFVSQATGFKNSIADKDPDFTVGQHEGATFFDGSIAHLALFNDMRTAGEILASYNEPAEDLSGAGNIIAQWHLDEPGAATAMDNTQGDAGRDLIPFDGGNETFANCGREVSSFANGDVVEVEYDQYYRVSSLSFSERRHHTGEANAATPTRSASLKLRGQIALE